MKDQHTKIKGYRELSQAEIDLMNAIKAEGERLGELVDRVNAHISQQQAATGSMEGEAQAAERLRLNAATPARWSALGRTHLQEGLMALVRSVAQPESF